MELKEYAIVAALLMTTSAYADPIYLECVILDESLEDGGMSIAVRLDESTGKVSHSTDKRAFSVEGIWSADTIRYKYVDEYRTTWTETHKGDEGL